MKILFFLTSSMEKPSPSWHLMKALLEDTLNAGIQVHAVQRHFSDSDTAPFPESILTHKLFTYSSVDSKTVSKKNFVKRYIAGFTYARKARKHFKKHNDYDMVFVQSAPTSLFYLILARHYAKKRPVLYNSQDMFPGSAIANGSMPQKWMQKIFYKLQKIAYRQADIITAISEDMKIKLIEQGVTEDKIRVIVNWYDDTSISEIDWNENKFVQKYNLSADKFYVQYAGTMGTNFNPQPILEVASILKDKNDIVFQMIGNGVRKEKFEKDAQKMGLTNIDFYPLQSQDMVSDVYSACSVCIIPLKPGVIGNSVPSKAGLLMAIGRVIVNSVDKDSDYYEMFEREKIGFCADVTETQKLADSIMNLYNNPELAEEYGKNAKVYAQKYYSRTYNTGLYTELFRKMVE